MQGIGALCFEQKWSFNPSVLDGNTCLKHNFSLKPNGSAAFSIAKQRVPCMTIFAMVKMFANQFLFKNEGINAIFCSKTNGACKTKTMLKRCMLKHYLVYGACAMYQNMYPDLYFLTISTWRSICHECKTCTPKVMGEQNLL